MSGVNPKDAAGRLKPCIHHLPFRPLYSVAKVMEHGAEKYGTRNWRVSEPLKLSTYVSATFRHLAAMWEGQWRDPESGEPHAAHIVANMLIVMDTFDVENLIFDGPGDAE